MVWGFFKRNKEEKSSLRKLIIISLGNRKSHKHGSSLYTNYKFLNFLVIKLLVCPPLWHENISNISHTTYTVSLFGISLKIPHERFKWKHINFIS